MAQAALRHIVLGLATSGLLMGCVQGNEATTTATPNASAPVRTTATGDVEAPEVFQTTDSALWDGRPSLGGIWVAAPDVQDPERVVMFNPATGKTVQGALFRRERDNPGPRLQISSDAAEALGILAGQPVEIRVTALRRAEPEPTPEAVPPAADTAVAAAEGTETTETAAAPAQDGDAAATAAAATAALAATGAAAVDAAGTATEAAPDAASETAVAEPPKRKTWKERRAEAKAAREAKKAAAAAAAAGVAAEAAAPDAAEVPATAEGVAVDAVAVTALDAPPAAATEAAAVETAAEPAAEAVVEPPKTRRQRRAEEAAAKEAAEAAAAEAAAAAAAAAAPAEAAPAAAAGRLIQVASFAKEANANRAVEALAKVGVTGQARKTDTNGKVVWSVVTTGDAAQLEAIKGFGFADAFFLQ